MVTTGQIVATLALAAAAASVPHVDAHGFIEVPKSDFPKGTSNPSEWIVEFPPPWEGNWKDPKNFAKAAKEKGFETLRSYIEDKGAVCGKTNPNATPRPIPSDNVVKFSRPIVHPGPCEIWLDDKRVMQDDDCESTFGSAIPTWKIDFSACKGKSKCMLRWFWLGLQDSGKRWQVYKNCVPVAGTGGGDSSSTTPAATTKAPATTTKPSSTKAPATTTKAPAATTKAPAAKTPKPAEVGKDAEVPSAGKNGTASNGVKCKAKRS